MHRHRRGTPRRGGDSADADATDEEKDVAALQSERGGGQQGQRGGVHREGRHTRRDDFAAGAHRESPDRGRADGGARGEQVYRPGPSH